MAHPSLSRSSSPVSSVQESENSATFQDILITSTLSSRPLRFPNFEGESKALRTLSRVMAHSPKDLPDTLLRIALELCKAGTAGLSLIETTSSGEQVFRWTNLAGVLQNHLGGFTPRGFSPCGTSLDTNSPQLFSFPARHFQYLSKVDVPIVEVLVVPLVGESPLGTIWIISHDSTTKFDAEDVRIMTMLAEFTSSALLMIRFLESERDARQKAEAEVERRTLALRKLSGRLLVMQDDERRRIARSLHDSVGQYLTALKIDLERLRRGGIQEQPKLFSECLESLDACLSETRIISHLLHPPLLEEAGLASAARSFVEEFARRSGMAVTFDASRELGRLPDEIEIALFRVLQESLTNVHRHSGSNKTEILLAKDAENVCLTIKDYGGGMTPALLNSFRNGGNNLGIGLAGLRERVHELGGRVELQSDPSGTMVAVTIPFLMKAGKSQRQK